MGLYTYKGQIITAETKQDAIAQIVTAAKQNTIRTRLKGKEMKFLISNILDNMPDSKIGDCEVALIGKDVVLKVSKDNGYLTKDKACFHIAKNMKRIIKEEGFEWSRNNTKVVRILSTGNVKFTVADCYKAYDLLLDRKAEKFDYDDDKNFRPEYSKAIVNECKKLSVKPKINVNDEKSMTTIELTFDKLAHIWIGDKKPHIPKIKIFLYNEDPDNEGVFGKKFRKMAVNYSGLVLDGPDYTYYCGNNERYKLKTPEEAAKTCTKIINDMVKVYNASTRNDDLRKQSKLKANENNLKLVMQLEKSDEELERLDDLVRKWDNR